MATVKEIAQAVIEMMNANKKSEENALEAKVKARDIKYPYQVFSIKRKDKVLGADAKLFVPTDAEKTNPLETSGFSRFEVTIVNKDNSGTQTATANIPANDIPYVMATTNIALQQMLIGKANVAPATSAPTSTAYTQKLFDKNFKGQTPAEVLLKDASQETQLLSVKSWLEQNVAKYPANKAQIVAITEAIDLLHAGKLTASDANASASAANIEVYKSEYKFKSKKNEKGYNLIYGIEVTCDPTRNYPFIVTIMNCYAPVETAAGGQKNIKMNAAEQVVKLQMMTTKEEWFGMITKMNETRTYFEQSKFDEVFHCAEIAGRY
jgi:hypothetical protein